MGTNEDLAERLGNVSHFMKLSLTDRLSIVLAGKICRFSQDEVLFFEGEECAGMFVLLKGHVHVCKLSRDGRQNIIAEINPVIMLNEVALLDGGPNPCTAIASKDTLTWRISLDAYQKLLKRYAQDKFINVAIGLMQILASRNRQLLNNYTDLSFLNVPARVAKLVFELSEQGQTIIDRHQHPIKEMAARIASTPEAISRSLNLLKCQGIIETTRTTIIVKKPDQMADLARIDLGSPVPHI